MQSLFKVVSWRCLSHLYRSCWSTVHTSGSAGGTEGCIQSIAEWSTVRTCSLVCCGGKHIPHPLSSVPTRLAHFQLSALCFNHRLDTQVGTVFQTMFESRNSKLEWNARGSGMPTLDHLTTVSVSFRFRSGT